MSNTISSPNQAGEKTFIKAWQSELKEQEVAQLATMCLSSTVFRWQYGTPGKMFIVSLNDLYREWLVGLS